MKFEVKKINPDEEIIYFSTPLPIVGNFYHTKEETSLNKILPETCDLTDYELLMLTSDFLYIKSKNKNVASDIEALALAEINEFNPQQDTVFLANNSSQEPSIKLLLKVIIAPFLQQDGGNIELISYEDHIIKVRFQGRCQGCPYAERTLKERVEKTLLKYIPKLKKVVAA